MTSTRDHATPERRAYCRDRYAVQDERNLARLRAWWRRWYAEHGRLPDVCAHQRQLRRFLAAPVTLAPGRRALQLRTTGDPRA